MTHLLVEWRTQWHRKSRRERHIVATVAMLLAAALLWAFAWVPLVRDLNDLDREVLRVRRDLGQARIDAEASTRLSRTGPPPMVEPRAALEASLAATGLRGAVTSTSWQDRRVQLVFADVPFPELVAWLERVHREGGLHVREATLSALVRPGMVRADLVLAR